MEYYNQFLKKIEVIKSYLVEFEEDSFMKSKIYLENCKVRDLNWRLIIFITHDKNTFNANNSWRQI